MTSLSKRLGIDKDILIGSLAFIYTAGLLVLVFVDSGNTSTVTRTLASGMYQGMLYFMVAAGLSIVFGLMDVLNFAQGGLFMLGAYVGFDVLTNVPQNATADSRLLTMFVMVNAPLVFVLIESLVGLIAKQLGKPLPIARHASIWEQMVVIALVGAPLGYLVGSVVSAGGSGDIIRGIGAAVVALIAMLDISRNMVMFGLRTLGETVSLAFQRGIAILFNQEYPQAQMPIWKPIKTSPDWVTLGAAVLATGLLGFLLCSTSLLVVRLGIAFAAATFAGAVAGVLMERLFIRPTYSRPFFQIVLTFGLALVIREIIVWRYDRTSLGNLKQFLPQELTGVIADTTIFNYWIFMIIMGLIMMISVQLLLKRTRIGIIIRAGVQDSEMVEALGINVRLIFTAVFALGAAIASLGGVISGGFLNIEPGLGDFFLLQAIAVVIIGGLGSYAGTAIASIMIGITRQVAAYLSRQYFNTDGLAPIVVLALLCFILMVKPSGLFGKEH